MKELVQVLAEVFPEVGHDTSRELKPVPPIKPGEEGVQNYIRTLKEANLGFLARTIETVHAEQAGGRNGEHIPTAAEVLRLDRYEKIARGLRDVVLANSDRIKTPARVETGSYAVGVPLGIITLALYDEMARLVDVGVESNDAIEHRRKTLIANGMKLDKNS